MKEVEFAGVKPQLVNMGFSDETLTHPQWDTYNNWMVRGRQVKRGKKSPILRLKIRQQILDTQTDDVLSMKEYDKPVYVFHHTQTDPVDKTDILEAVGNYDDENGRVCYESSVTPEVNGSDDIEESVDEKEKLFDKMNVAA